MNDKSAWGKLVHRVQEQPTRTPTATVSGGYGVVASAESQVDTTKQAPQPRPMSPKDAQALMTAELLQAVRGVVDSTTELTARIGRQGATNGVLEVALVTIDASGVYERDYPVTVGSVGIVNHSDQPLTVHSGPAGYSAPVQGIGVQRIEPRSYLVMPVGQRGFAVWGTPGALMSMQVFTGLQPWGGGAL